ncbi:MAG: acyltransferase [Polyangiaceae bacterium]
MAGARGIASADTRLASIEVMRVVSAFAIVGIHTTPPLSGLLGRLGLARVSAVGADLYRFSVPFFLASAGYFLGCAQLDESKARRAITKRVTRLMWIFLFWALVFNVVPLDWHKELFLRGPLGMVQHQLGVQYEAWRAAPVSFAFEGGGGFHLWFLSALATAYALIGLAQRLGFARWLLPLAVLLYVWSVVSLAYAPCWNFTVPEPPLGAYSVNAALLPVVAGWKLGRREWRAPTLTAALLVTAVAGAASVFELWGVSHLFGVPKDRGWVFSTWLLGLGVLLIAIARPNLGRGSWLAQLGKYTLGIYLLHPLFDAPAFSIAARLPFGPDLVTLTVFALALVATVVVSRLSWAKKVLT